jgi:hypothetical protein
MSVLTPVVAYRACSAMAFSFSENRVVFLFRRSNGCSGDWYIPLCISENSH